MGDAESITFSTLIFNSSNRTLDLPVATGYLDTMSSPQFSVEYPPSGMGIDNAISNVTLTSTNVRLTLDPNILASYDNQILTLVYYDNPGDQMNVLQSSDGDDVESFTQTFTYSVQLQLETAETNNDGSQIILTYSEALLTSSVPNVEAFTVKVNGTTITVQYVTIEVTKVTLTIVPAIQNGESVTFSYNQNGSPIQTTYGKNAETPVDDFIVAFRPELLTVETNNDGSQIILTYDQALLTSSVPNVEAFTVTIDNTKYPIDGVTIEGDTNVVLSVNPVIQKGETVIFSYNQDNDNPIQTTYGLNSYGYQFEVDNQVEDVTVIPSNYQEPTLIKTLDDTNVAHAMAIDSNQNIYILKTAEEPFASTLVSLQKYNNQGVFVSEIKFSNVPDFGGYINYSNYYIVVDSNNNVYIAGEPGSSHQGFLVKFSSTVDAFTLLWAIDIAHMKPTGLAIDSNDNLYVTTINTVTPDNGSWRWASYIVKYLSDGTELFTQQLSSIPNGRGRSIAFDSNNNFYVTGINYTNINGSTYKDNGDVFIAKYSSEAENIWIKQFGTYDTDIAFLIAIDNNNNVCIAGRTGGKLVATAIDQAGYSERDIFLAKYSENGEQLWITQMGSSNTEDDVYAMAIDNNNNIFITGYTHVEDETDEMFLTKYSTSGNQDFIKQFVVSENDYWYSEVPRALIAIDMTDDALYFLTRVSLSDASTDVALFDAGQTVGIKLRKYDINNFTTLIILTSSATPTVLLNPTTTIPTTTIVATYAVANDTVNLTLSDTTNYSLDTTNKKVVLTEIGVSQASMGLLPQFTLTANDSGVSTDVTVIPSIETISLTINFSLPNTIFLGDNIIFRGEELKINLVIHEVRGPCTLKLKKAADSNGIIISNNIATGTETFTITSDQTFNFLEGDNYVFELSDTEGTFTSENFTIKTVPSLISLKVENESLKNCLDLIKNKLVSE